MNSAAESKKPMNLDKLAGMVQVGFNEVKKDFSKLEQKVDDNHEEIKLKLDNVAYRFELVELQRRVHLLEKKASFRK
jgi:hypothetical protein